MNGTVHFFKEILFTTEKKTKFSSHNKTSSQMPIFACTLEFERCIKLSTMGDDYHETFFVFEDLFQKSKLMQETLTYSIKTFNHKIIIKKLTNTETVRTIDLEFDPKQKVYNTKQTKHLNKSFFQTNSSSITVCSFFFPLLASGGFLSESKLLEFENFEFLPLHGVSIFNFS
jgi:hypothetical protein